MTRATALTPSNAQVDTTIGPAEFTVTRAEVLRSDEGRALASEGAFKAIFRIEAGVLHRKSKTPIYAECGRSRKMLYL